MTFTQIPDKPALFVVYVGHHRLGILVERRWRGNEQGWVVVGDDRCGWFRDRVECVCASINVTFDPD
jgi:hypothetical protein